MKQLLKIVKKPEEGEIINRWIENRFNANKNILGATTGPTGSGKSYQDLRRVELWYKHKFNEEFPEENICFSIIEIVSRIYKGNLRKGEILVLEESGVNLASLDFQNKVSKMFTYVLQSFRSLNIGIFFNLPYLSMLNKSARMLLHVHFQTKGINASEKTAKSKALFRQVNQVTGKVYSKYLRVKVNGRMVAVKALTYNLPSKRLIDLYEAKKQRFLSEMGEDYIQKLDKMERDKIDKIARKDLTERQREIYEMKHEGLNQTQIASELEIDVSAVSRHIQAIKKKGYDVV